MAESIVKQSLLRPECRIALDLVDEISRRTVQASAICRLAGEAQGEHIGKVLRNSMWCVECLLNDASELVDRLYALTDSNKSAIADAATGSAPAAPATAVGA